MQIMTKVAKASSAKAPLTQRKTRVGGVAHQSVRNVPELSQDERQLFGGLSAQAGFTLANAEKIYKKS
jgi:hypothetical protein